MFVRCFVQVGGADDVGLDDVFKRVLGGDAAEVQHRFHAFKQLHDRSLVGQVALDDFLALPGFAQVGDVGQYHYIGPGFDAITQNLTQAAGGAGQQQTFEWLSHSLFLSV